MKLATLCTVVLLLSAPPLRTTVASPAPHRELEVHVWNHEGDVGPLSAGTKDDFWTRSGIHYLFNGTRLGGLSFGSAEPPQVSAVRVGPGGGLFVTARGSDVGWFVSSHDSEGRQLWMRPLGRVAPRGAAKGPTRHRDQEEPPSAVSFAEVIGVSADGSVLLSGWLQGCVDLAPEPSTFVDCATLDRAGKNTQAGQDAFPQLFFATRFDVHGRWEGSQTFPRLPVTGSAWSQAQDILALTLRGGWTGPISVHTPQTRGNSPSSGHSDARIYQAAVAFVDRHGRAQIALQLRSGTGTLIRSAVFDTLGQLWLLIDAEPSLELRGGDSKPMGMPLGRCATLLYLPNAGAPPRTAASVCTDISHSATIPMEQSLVAGPDGRVIVNMAPAELVDGDTLALPAQLPTDGERGAPRLVVTRGGVPDWSAQISTGSAVALTNGWTCFATLKSMACVRPTALDGRRQQPGDTQSTPTEPVKR
jgi:hypothetical protein